MSYQVDSILKVILNLKPSGLSYANFQTGLIFAVSSDLNVGITFANDTFKDYSSLTELAVDFTTSSATYKIATRWFANTPQPDSITVWMKVGGDTVTQASNKAAAALFRFFHFWPSTTFSVEADVLALATWGDANERFHMFGTADAATIDPASTTDIAYLLKAQGNRFCAMAYQPGSGSQIYAGVQLCSAFYKFRPLGLRTAITGEYQVLPGVTGQDLSTTAYNSLRAKNTICITKVELKGSVDNCRVINSKTMSSYGEFMDDVINLAVLKNYLQVAGYNYIANAGTKRPLTPIGYAGLLHTLDQVCKIFYNNGVLGDSTYLDEIDGETKRAKFGYVIQASPEDVLSLTDVQRSNRAFPTTRIIVILARAGHTAEITVNVE